jgi:hypothetical protein
VLSARANAAPKKGVITHSSALRELRSGSLQVALESRDSSLLFTRINQA